MAALRINTNENIHVAEPSSLSRRGVDSWTARNSGNLGLSDVEHLEYANKEKAVVLTHDTDFLRLAGDWEAAGKSHYGIIFTHEQFMSLGEMIRRLQDLALILEAEDMINRVEFL